MNPPFLAHLLVRARRLGERNVEVEADMLELFRERLREGGRFHAWFRYWRDAASLWLHPIPSSVLPAVPRRLRVRLASDIRWAWRSLCAHPAASLGVVFVLSLGIGLAAAMFALADPYILRPLPFLRPEELVTISPPQELPLPRAAQREDTTTVADWQARKTLFAEVAAFDDAESIQVGRGDRLVSLRATPVSASFFPLLGLRPPARPDWRTTTGQTELPIVVADESLGSIGSVLDSPDGRRWRIAGFLPLTFVFPDSRSRIRVTALRPLVDERLTHSGKSGTLSWSNTLTLIGRLHPGITAKTASEALLPSRPLPFASTRPPGPAVESLSAAMTRQARALAIGATVAGLLVFLACATNVGNLLTTRGTHRWREFAARQAMGATRRDLARLVFVELTGLTIASTAGGLALTAVALKAMTVVIPAGYAALGAPAITARVAAFAMLTGLIMMVLGTIPAAVALRANAGSLFSRTQPTDGGHIRVTRFAMTATQTAIAMVLLIGGSLLVRSYERLTHQDIGFSADAFVLTVTYPSGQESRLVNDIEETIARLRLVRGVHSPAAVRGPLADGQTMKGLAIVNGQWLFAGAKTVTPGYTDATGSVIVAGRFFASEDGGSARVVNQAFAKLCCQNRSPIGSVVALNEGRTATIVGVLKNAFDSALDEPSGPVMFRPVENGPSVSSGGAEVHYVFRTDGPPQALVPTAERQILSVNASGVVSTASTLGDRLSNTVRDRSFATLVVMLFGVTALAVSSTGLFAVIGFAVARRTREIAIRIAVGAPASHVRWLVAREALAGGAVGAACGLIAGGWLSGTLTHLLYGIEPLDLWSFAAAALAVIATALIAAAIPAHRALRIAPTDALRCE